MKRDENAVARARAGRHEPTNAELNLWALLRDRRLIKRKFRRQHVIGRYVVDFACPAIKLVIEVDGPSHDAAEQRAFDEQRTEYLQRSGWRVLRVTNTDVYTAFGEVEAIIVSAIGD
ncbi:possible DNA methylase [alpha proteobacterium U9-1i]|nr:possible DNA methylase [alpha proteobacterium U9-1i]